MVDEIMVKERKKGSDFFFLCILYFVIFSAYILIRPLWLSRVEKWTKAEAIENVVTKEQSVDEPAVDIKPVALSPQTTNPTNISPLEARIVDITNDFRTRVGLPKLVPDPQLVDVAQKHSKDMASRGFVDSISPDGSNFRDRIAHSHRRLVGLVYENIIRYQGQIKPDAMAQEVVERLMHSPEHRRNIMRPNVTHIGVGTADANNTYYFTQCFASVWAYLDADLPFRIPTHKKLQLAGEVAEGIPTVTSLDLYSTMDLNQQVSSAQAVLKGRRFRSDVKFPSKPGHYQFAVRFQGNPAGRLSIGGPSFEVVSP